MFLCLKQNLREKLSKLTKISSQLLRNANVSNFNFKFHDKVTFDKLDSSQSNEIIDKFFSQHEQYIANFYKKHKDNFLFQETHDREFEEFLIQMESLINKDLKRKSSVRNYINDMGKISLQSRESLREVLIYYQMFLTKNGFDSDVTSETLLFIGKLYQSRENFHRIYSDFTHWDFINSYRTYHIIEDLKFGVINENSFMNASQIAKSIKGLTLCGYKNTQLVDLVFERIISFLTKEKMNKKFEKFADAPGAGKFKYGATNLHAEDLFTNENFRKHLFKLSQLTFETETTSGKQFIDVTETTGKQKQTDYDQELLAPIKEIIGLLKETKEIQHNLTDSIDNLLDQYYTIEQALLENPELKDNQYIKYELFKLQDKLVEGGYLTIEALNEVTKQKLTDEQLEKLKHENIIAVLRDFALINFPNLYNEGENKLDLLLEDTDKIEDFKLNSSSFKMTHLALGECLAYLSDYSKITNVDINGEDFINAKIVKEFTNKNFMKDNKEQIKIKAEYTKLFYNTESFLKRIEPLISKLVEESKDISALGYIYYAYANMNIASLKELKNQILSKLMSLLELEHTKFNSNEEIKYLIMGLAKGEIRSEKVVKIVSKVASYIKLDAIYKIDDMVKLLWGLSAFKLITNSHFIDLMIKLSHNADGLINYITNQTEFNMYLYQLSVSLKYEAKESITIPSNLNNLLDLHLNMRELAFTKLSYGMHHKEIQTVPNEMLIDPVKLVVLNGMQDGIFCKEIQKNYSLALTDLECSDSPGSLPFFPDLVFGFFGHKVALFIIGKDYVTDDLDVTNPPVNGYCHVIKRILKEKFNTHAVFIPTSQLIKFDLKTVHMDLLYTKEGFTNHLENIIAKQLNLTLEHSKVFQINKYLNAFIKQFSSSETGEVVLQTESSAQLENFMNSLLNVIDLHSELVHSYHSNLINKKVDDLKKQLEKNKLYFVTMSDNFKLFVNSIVAEITKAQIDYNIFLDSFSKSYEVISHKNIHKEANLVISSEWMGKRLNVDLISSSKNIKDKNIAVELINNNFMWLGEYNAYEDWEQELKTKYDNFNYFVENSKNKFMFNSHKLGHRNVPCGVFPHPGKFRAIKSPLVTKTIEAKSDYEYELKSYKNYNEKIISEEVEKNKRLEKQERGEEISLKVNLLNIKNSLKQNLNDNQIVKFISNFEFIDKLIDEHVNIDYRASNTKFVKRDPEAFKNFYKKVHSSTPQYDEYDKFIMREYYNEKKIFEVDSSAPPEQNMKKMEERMTKKLEENEDNDAISIYSPNNTDYAFNINSVLSSGKSSDVDADVLKEEFNTNPEKFVIRKRLLAERNLILLRIIVKLLNSEIPESSENILSENELKYINSLISKLQQTDLNNIDDLGVKDSLTQLTFENLTANDTYALNSLYNVEITEQIHKYSLNELMLELSHFIDNSTIAKFLHHLYERLVVKTDRKTFLNKEPTLLSNEIKETLWRLSGFLNEEDKIKLKNMLRVKRGKSKFDKIWLKLDEKSLEDFLKTANTNENRMSLLEKWIKRKEKEVENRIDLPPDNLAMSDSKINQLMERKDKSYRRTVLFNIFKIDDLSKIDSRRVNQFISEFCGSLYLFNFKYPQTIRDIFNALEDVPSLCEEDRQLLKSYKLFFQVEDNNPFEYISVVPVKLEGEKLQVGGNIKTIDDFLDEKLLNRIKSSNVPFIPAVVDKLILQIRK